MASEQIVFFDLPGRAPNSTTTPWSLNPWKTRMLLNYKGLDYRTEWTEYPDIRPRLEGHVAPNSSDTPYTIPTIRLPSGEYITDSKVIATKIESLHPTPPVHLDSPVLAKLEAIMRQIMPTFAPMYLPRIPRNVLNEASIPYWRRTREGWVNMTLEEYEATKGGALCFDKMEPLLREVTALLEETEAEGPFFLGGEVSYADFVWGGYLIFCQRMGEGAYEEVLRRSGNAEAHEKLLEGIKPWTERKD